MNFAGNLKRTMKARKMSTGRLAKTVGLSERVIWKYRNGEVTPQMATARKIAKALDTTIDALLAESPEEAPAECAPCK